MATAVYENYVREYAAIKSLTTGTTEVEYIFYLQMWTAIASGGPSWPIASGGPSWPVPRSFHSAVSLHHPESDHAPNPALMVMWGAGDTMILNDSWVFQLNVRQWRKVLIWTCM